MQMYLNVFILPHLSVWWLSAVSAQPANYSNFQNNNSLIDRQSKWRSKEGIISAGKWVNNAQSGHRVCCSLKDLKAAIWNSYWNAWSVWSCLLHSGWGRVENLKSYRVLEPNSVVFELRSKFYEGGSYREGSLTVFCLSCVAPCCLQVQTVPKHSPQAWYKSRYFHCFQSQFHICM